jgi:ribonuclease P protein component
MRKDALGRIVACNVRSPHALPGMTPRRLHRSRDIRAVFAARNVAHGRLMTVHAVRRFATSAQTLDTSPSGEDEPGRASAAGLDETAEVIPGTSVKPSDDQARVAVVAGREVGGSVQRNRAKRRLRATLAAEPLPPCLDFVVRARPAAVAVDFADLQAELAELIGRVVAKACAGPAQAGGRQA